MKLVCISRMASEGRDNKLSDILLHNVANVSAADNLHSRSSLKVQHPYCLLRFDLGFHMFILRLILALGIRNWLTELYDNNMSLY